MMPTFASPEWLWCLLLLPPLLSLRAWSHLRARRGAAGLVSPRLTKDLIIGARQWSRWVVFSLQLAALALLLLALARPQWGFEIADEETDSRNVVIAIDTSRSMLANDLTPDRLTRAKLAAEDIVMALPEDRIALIAFAGRAFVQAPLTLDHDAVIESIQQFDTELIPRGGSNLTKAAELAIELLEKVDSRDSALIIFSDGEALEGREELESIVEKAKAVGLTVVAIGVGTDSGSIIPEPDDKGNPQPGVFITDDEGNVVRSRLDPTALQELSRTLGGGAYLDLGATQSIASAVSDALRQIEATRGVSLSSRRPIDRFVWPLSAALCLLVASWLLPGTTRLIERLLAAGRSRPSPAPDPGIASPSARRTAATTWAALILSGSAAAAGIGEVESPAYEAYRKQQFSDAIASYRQEIETAEPGRQRAWLNLGLGAAAYQSGDLALAQEAFGRTLAEGDKALSERAHYNLANTLFRNGEALLRDSAHPKNPNIPKDEAAKQSIATQWQAAREHYQAALALDGSDADARHNLSVVEKRIELLNQPPPPEEEEQEEEDKEEEQEEQKDQQQQQQQNQNSPQQPPPGDQPPPQEQPDQPQDQPPGEPDQEQPPGNQPPPEPGKDQADQPPQKPEPQQPPNEPAPDGKLESQPDQGERESQPPQPSEKEVNPETGFSPEEARQKLRTLADEDTDVRPPINVPIQAEKFKNW